MKQRQVKLYPPSQWAVFIDIVALQSFSKMWVEFLLKEANQGSAPSTPTGLGPIGSNGLLGSPRLASHSGLPSLSKTNSGATSKANSAG